MKHEMAEGAKRISDIGILSGSNADRMRSSYGKTGLGREPNTWRKKSGGERINIRAVTYRWRPERKRGLCTRDTVKQGDN